MKNMHGRRCQLGGKKESFLINVTQIFNVIMQLEMLDILGSLHKDMISHGGTLLSRAFPSVSAVLNTQYLILSTEVLKSYNSEKSESGC